MDSYPVVESYPRSWRDNFLNNKGNPKLFIFKFLLFPDATENKYNSDYNKVHFLIFDFLYYILSSDAWGNKGLVKKYRGGGGGGRSILKFGW